MLLQTLGRRRPRVRLRVLKSYAGVSREMIFWSYFLCHSHRLAAREIIISQIAMLFFYRTVLFAYPFFFHISILERIASSHVYRASTTRRPITCVECTTPPPDLVPQFLANDFVISVLRALVTRAECMLEITFVSNPTKLNRWGKVETSKSEVERAGPKLFSRQKYTEIKIG